MTHLLSHTGEKPHNHLGGGIKIFSTVLENVGPLSTGLPQIPGKPGKLHFWAKIPAKPGKWHFFQGKERLKPGESIFPSLHQIMPKNDDTKIYN